MPQEIGELLKAAGQFPTEEDIEDLVEQLDADGSGGLNLAEFLEVVSANPKGRDLSAELIEAFKILDEDADGFLSKDELRKAAKKFHSKLSEQDILQMVAEADSSFDGKISFPEFERIMKLLCAQVLWSCGNFFEVFMLKKARVLTLLALCIPALAFVPPAQQPVHQAVAPAGASAAPEVEAASSFSTLAFGASVGYACAAVGAAARQGRVARRAEKASVARTPVAYPIFTFRWLAVHALVVPTVFFLGAISSMQFIQR
ncbi:unnamed protein product [Effrenium voratum]|uniref:Calmodulin n=1 Tax=Effrenium voratum TaxID=2562239 RepID=A0AA36HJB9_9DINO|nr:unnamed protein product [Effrenium voratum]